MATDTTYNGWPNYETWCVNLWLTNEQGSDAMLQSIVNDSAKDYRASFLKEYVIEFAPLDGANMYVDLLQAALDNVDWREIIRVHQEDFDLDVTLREFENA